MSVNERLAQLRTGLVALEADYVAETVETDKLIGKLNAEIVALKTPVPLPTPVIKPDWQTDWTKSPALNGFKEQFSPRPGPQRITYGHMIGGRVALRLHTEPGDNNVHGSLALERADVYQAHPGGAPIMFKQGEEQWWAHSIWLPDDFTMPTWQVYVLMDFHNTLSGASNFHVMLGGTGNENGDMQFLGYGGAQDQGRYRATIGKPQKNVWYDFVYHVKWSSGSDGFFDAWVNGQRKLSHRGPTLYVGQDAYLKLANYHTPINHPNPGPASTVYHSDIMRAKTVEGVRWRADGQNLVRA